MLPKATNLTELLDKWQKVSYEAVPSDFIALPFMNINSRRISYISIEMISLQKIVPPTIPRTYLAKFSQIAGMISAIEAKGNFEVIVRDCSLGKGFPVVAVIYINKDNQSYFVKFGAHPVLEIAAERILTELLQGQDVKNMLGVREFEYRHNLSGLPDNIIGIMVNGSGGISDRIF